MLMKRSRSKLRSTDHELSRPRHRRGFLNQLRGSCAPVGGSGMGGRVSEYVVRCSWYRQIEVCYKSFTYIERVLPSMKPGPTRNAVIIYVSSWLHTLSGYSPAFVIGSTPYKPEITDRSGYIYHFAPQATHGCTLMSPEATERLIE